MRTCRTRDVFVRHSLLTLHRHTHQPLWRILTLLSNPSAAHTAPIPPRFRQLALGNTTLESLHLPEEDIYRTWLHVYSLFRECRSPKATVDVLVDPILDALPRLPVHYKAPMLVLGAAHLATWNLVLPLEHLTREFLDLPHPIATPIYTSRRAAQQRAQQLALLKEDVIQVDQEQKRVLTFPDAPTSELYTNLYLRALALTPTYSTAYAHAVRRVITRLDALRPPSSGSDPQIQVPTSSSPYTIHPDTYTCLLLSTHNALSAPGRVPHQSSLLSPPLATFLAARLLSEPGSPSPGVSPGADSPQPVNPNTNDPAGTERETRPLMTQTHREALLRFWALEAKAGGARGKRGRENVRELWAEIQAYSSSAEGEGEGQSSESPVALETALSSSLEHPKAREDADAKTESDTPRTLDVKDDLALRANTLYLSAQPSVHGIRQLLSIFAQASSRSSTPSTAKGVAAGHSSPTPSKPSPKVDAPETPPKQLQPLKLKPALDAYDLTATLSAAANDGSVDVEGLRGVWGRLGGAFGSLSTQSGTASKTSTSSGLGQNKGSVKQGGRGRVPLAAHTAYLRGLYWRGAFEEARVWWEDEVFGKSVWAAASSSANVSGSFTTNSNSNSAESSCGGSGDEMGTIHKRRGEGEGRDERYVLDAKAITIGVQILVRCGRAEEGILLLDRVSRQPCRSSSSPSPKIPSPTHNPSNHSNPPPPPIPLTPISLLSILVSLNRSSRPDIVFALFTALPTLFPHVSPTAEMVKVVLGSARRAFVADAESLGAQVRKGVRGMFGGRGWFGGGRKGGVVRRGSASGSGRDEMEVEAGKGRGEREAEEERKREREEALECVLEVARRKEYVGGRLWGGLKPEDAAREVFLQCLFGMEVGYRRFTSGSTHDISGRTQGHSTNPSDPTYQNVGLANVRAPACAVRKDWDSDAGVVGLGVGLPELRLRRFEYRPGPEMYDWVAVPPPGADHPSMEPTLTPRPLYPSISLPNSAFLSYLSLLAVTRRTTEVALTLAWMRELGVQPSESTLALGMVLWEEVSVEGPLVEVIAGFGRQSHTGDGRKEPRDEFERLVFWIEDWVGPGRVPGVDVLRKWRGVVRDMREPGMAEAVRTEARREKEERKRRREEVKRERREERRRGQGGRGSGVGR